MAVAVRSKRERGFPAENVSLSACATDILFLLVMGVPSFVGYICTQASLAKLAQTAPKSLTALVIAL